ncbi:RidA family protein [Marispirochaeta sp.]|jgi:enamine deaminase RidA (YjgF/YER057c/UK114 family)|uniref:RidA family protein n=1 Tax=Marispirochaeta sp. TaxID=2038653 RepID=UPI0029C9502B|nr:RidA family protein [Marispirochaeta sp.]
MIIEQKLKELQIVLPEAPKPAAMYIPVKQIGNALFVSGQIPFRNGELVYSGKVGSERSLEEAQDAAEICVLNIIAVAKEYLGNLDKIKNVTKLQGFVNSEATFNKAHIVVNAASKLLYEIFGEAGRHARTVVCTNELPLDATVEIEAIIELIG